MERGNAQGEFYPADSHQNIFMKFCAEGGICPLCTVRCREGLAPLKAGRQLSRGHPLRPCTHFPLKIVIV